MIDVWSTQYENFVVIVASMLLYDKGKSELEVCEIAIGKHVLVRKASSSLNHPIKQEEN